MNNNDMNNPENWKFLSIRTSNELMSEDPVMKKAIDESHRLNPIHNGNIRDRVNELTESRYVDAVRLEKLETNQNRLIGGSLALGVGGTLFGIGMMMVNRKLKKKMRREPVIRISKNKE